MPVDYTIRADLNLVLVVFSGLVRAEENIAAVEAYRTGPGYDPLHHLLMDLAECRFPTAFFADMRLLRDRLGYHYKARDPRSHTSIFAPGDVAYGMGRLFRSSVNRDAPNPVGVFRRAEEALRFVDLDPVRPEARRLLRPAWGTGRRLLR